MEDLTENFQHLVDDYNMKNYIEMDRYEIKRHNVFSKTPRTPHTPRT